MDRMPLAERPLFSIVTVCWNAERTIRNTIESVLHQEPFGATVEHIIVDGASTDGTLKLLAAYPHLRVVSERDAGIYDAMNKGVALAGGEYIGILNADDWYEPEALRSVAEALRASPESEFVHGDIRRWQGDVPFDIVRPPRGTGFWKSGLIPVNHPASFVNKDVFDRFGGFDISYRTFADFEWVTRVINGGVRPLYCPQVLTNFRMGGVSAMRFAIAERYRVYRTSGVGVLPASAANAYSCAVVLRNRLLRRTPR